MTARRPVGGCPEGAGPDEPGRYLVVMAVEVAGRRGDLGPVEVFVSHADAVYFVLRELVRLSGIRAHEHDGPVRYRGEIRRAPRSRPWSAPGAAYDDVDVAYLDAESGTPRWELRAAVDRTGAPRSASPDLAGDG